MAKIVESITYKNKICQLEKEKGNLCFYSYSEDGEVSENENLLVVNKQSKEILANIKACHGIGAYGMTWEGFKIDNE